MNETIRTNNFKEANALLTLIFCAYLSYCFFEAYLNQVIGNYGKYLIFIIIICFLIAYRRIYIAIRWYHFFIVAWLVVKVASIYWVSYNYIVQLHFISQIGMVALFITMTMVDFDDRFSMAVENTLLYLSGFMGVLCLFFSQPYLGDFEARQVLTLMGIQTDPNNQSAFLLIGIALSLYRLFNGKGGRLSFLILGSITAVNIYAILMTGSRGGLLSAALIAVCAALFVDAGKGWTAIHVFRNTVIVCVAGAVTYFAAKYYLFTDTFDRVFDMTEYAGGSGRIAIWENALKIFWQNPLFGGGWGSYWGYNDYYEAVHNTFISVLSDGGIVGFILIFTPVFYIGLKSLEQRYALPFLILAAGFAPAFFLDAINKRFFWNAIIIAFILINNRMSKASEMEGTMEDQRLYMIEPVRK